jgi:two-component system, NarL family, nitrate/nitrite response regulator NarL
MNREHTLCVLLLEDEGIQRAGMKALIQNAAHRASIHEAGTYDEAVRKIGEAHFDIAFIDYNLREKYNGLDLLKEIRRTNLDTRVIMLSSVREREIILACIDAGASGYITKEMDAEGLFEQALDTVFKGAIFLPATALGPGARLSGSASSSKPIPADSLGIKGRKLDALYYLCQGYPNKLIARKIGVSEETVRKYYNPCLFRLFGVVRRTELILEVSRRNLIVPKPDPSAEHSSHS